MISLTYVSVSTLPDDVAGAEVSQVVNLARRRNVELTVTGALIFTGTHFAQLIEGPKASIDALMTSIVRDDRHTRLRVVERIEIAGRRFPDWQMAYQGSATYVDVPLGRLIDAPTEIKKRDVQRIFGIMKEFTRA